MSKTAEEILQTQDDPPRFETTVDESVNEDGTVGDTGATQEQLNAITDALDEDSRYETGTPEADKVDTKPDDTPPPKGGDDKKEEEETPAKGAEDELGKAIVDALDDKPKATETFDSFEIKYTASGEEKTRKVESIEEIEQAFSKSEGLVATISAKDEIIKGLETSRDTERQRTERVVKSYRRKETQDKELEPIFDLVRKNPELRNAILTDKRFAPALREAGVTNAVVTYDYEMAGQKADLADRAEEYDNKEIDTASEMALTEFIAEFEVPPEDLAKVIELSKGTDDFQPLRDESGKLKPMSETITHWRTNLEKNYGRLALKGEVKTKAVKVATKGKQSAEEQIATMKEINANTRHAKGAPGAAGGVRTGTKPVFARKEGESNMEFNARWLKENPEEAAKFNEDLKRH